MRLIDLKLTTTSHKFEAVPRIARLQGSCMFVSINSRLESNKEEETGASKLAEHYPAYQNHHRQVFRVRMGALQGYLAHTKRPPPSDLHRARGIGLPKGPRGGLFLMSETPLYRARARAHGRCFLSHALSLPLSLPPSLPPSLCRGDRAR